MPVYRLPELTYDYGALEPAISGEIMELHHSAHHASYVKGANSTLERIGESRETRDFTQLPGLERALTFHLEADYVERLWSLVNWADVGARFDAARTGRLIGLFGTEEGEPR
ncbi:hypothetical protein ACL02S_11715 [Nocardia sp. 004]|uniref:hypothetical protein n=1 Tax=Nocardia sp. 004 TaxID=3385978 RepID=UPI0039A1FBF4